MDYEQLSRSDSEIKTPPHSTRHTFDQFSDFTQCSPNVFTTGDSPSKSSLHTFGSEHQSAVKSTSDWGEGVSKSVPTIKPLSASEQMRRFSNRYLYETTKCSRYSLMGEYFKREKPLSEMLKTPQNLNKPSKKKSLERNERNILVQPRENFKQRSHAKPIDNLKREHVARITSTIDGGPWKPKALLDRPECSWYRKHRLNTQTEPVKRHQAPNLLRPSNLVRLSKVGTRETNSFFKPVLGV